LTFALTIRCWVGAVGTFGAIIAPLTAARPGKRRTRTPSAHLFAVAFFDARAASQRTREARCWSPIMRRRLEAARGLGNVLLTGVSFVPQTRWVVGYQGTILQTDDGGATWRALNALVTTDPVFRVFFTDELTAGLWG